MKTRVLIYDRNVKLYTFVNFVDLTNPNIYVFAMYQFPINQKLFSFGACQQCEAALFASKYGKKIMSMVYSGQGHPWRLINESN